METTVKNILLKLNGDDAEKDIKKYKNLLIEANEAKKKLEDAHLNGEAWTKKDIAALKKLNKEIVSSEAHLRKAGMTAGQVDEVLQRLDKATLKEMQGSLRQLEKAFREAPRGSAEWATLKEKIATVKAEIRATREVQQTMTEESKTGLAEFGQKWMGVAVIFDTVRRAASAMFAKMTESVTEYAAMSENTANVSKYTGLAAEDVSALNDEFKRMDTRTSREELNDLAADAGRLGITAKQDILDFVCAADQINVALGEDLGEGAVKEIGKLAQMFGDDRKMGLKQAMLSTASVINELAQSSSASEGYLMEFTSRLAGVGKQAGMTQAQLFGLGSVLDQNKVNVEKGATALQNVMTALFANTEKMAKVAGLNVEEFSQLLSRDANEALLVFVSRLNDLGGMDKVAPALKEMNLSGAGVTQMLTTLAANVDAVRQTQEQATAAYRDGTSATNEAAKANATAQAEIEKQQKRLKDLRVELGEKLLPIQTSFVNGQIGLTNAIVKVTAFLAKYGAAVTALTTYILVNIATVKMKMAWDTIEAAGWRAKTALIWANIKATTAWKVATQSAAVGAGVFRVAMALLTGGLAAARVQFVLLRAAMLKSPFGLIALAVSALAYGIVKLTGLFDDDTEAVEKNTSALAKNKEEKSAVQKAQERGAENAARERTRIELLNQVLHDNRATLAQKRQALEELKRTIPGYLGHLTTEGKLENDNVAAIRSYISALEDKATAEAIYEELVEQKKRERTAKKNRERKENNVRLVQNQIDNNPDLRKDTVIMPYVGAVEVESDRKLLEKKKELTAQQNALNDARARESEEIKKSNELSQEYLRLQQKTGDSSLTSSFISTDTSTSGGGNSGGSTSTKSAAQRIEEDANRARLAEDMAYATGLKTYSDYQSALARIEREAAEKKVQAEAENSAERVKAEREYYALLQRQRTENTSRTIAELKDEEEQETRMAQSRYANGKTNEEQYQQELRLIRLKYATARAETYSAAGDTENAKKERTAFRQQELNDQLTLRKEYLSKVQQLENEYSKKTLEQRKEDELALLAELVKAGVVSKEQEVQFKAEIEKKYINEQKNAADTAKREEEQRQEDMKQKRKEAYDIGTPTDSLTASVVQFEQSLLTLFQKIKDGKATWADFAQAGLSAMSLITAAMSAVSNLFAAQQEMEVAAVERKYERQIAAAGTNSKRAKRLEEKKKKEEAAIKNKYQRKQNKIALATAIVQTAQNALMAYGSLAWIPTVGPVLGAIAAAAALAAGAIQIAAIKKQQAAQGEFYEGGFTGGNRYRREAGVVHEGEFVANHLAVRNPALVPVLRLIDSAQRTNTVASLSAEDVSRVVTAPQMTSAAASRTAAVTTTSLIAPSRDAETAAAIRRLNENLEAGIRASVAIDGQDGLERQWTRYQKMKNV